ncbi:MAG: protein kinase [Ignavibacteriales bacterium]|nr:protein kinase [Ignavibacteriales bacterium]
MIGQKISHYKILEKLGEGGMGVVYKAHDLKLDRIVALKFLPHHLTSNEAEQARFLQEARAASALNHPNICAIYSIGEEGEMQFIEMEFVDGVTLREKTEGGKLQIAGCVGYAVQIGEALQEAHSKGIVHRDVKMDNIMVNAKDQVKVMDFGLAKLKGSLKLTKTSSTVGTLAYMAPEQIEGGEVDARSDIFSFGVVLYEMLTGHLPFRGEHEAAMVYSIVNEEPEPIEKYRTDLSPVLVNLIQRALEKNPGDRYQSMSDMVIELKRLLKKTSKVVRSASQVTHRVGELEGTPTTGEAVSPAESGSGKSSSIFRNKLVIIGAAIVAVIIVVGALYEFVLKKESTSPRTFSVQSMKVTRLTSNGKARQAAVSPDGRYVVFSTEESGKRSLWVRQVATNSNIQIIPPLDVTYYGLTISQDGNYVFYVAYQRTTGKSAVYQVPVLGGTPRKILDDVDNPIALSPDNKMLTFVRYTAATGTFALMVAKTDGSEPKELASHKADQWFAGRPAWSPDGKVIACALGSWEGGFHHSVVTVQVEGGAERRFTRQRWYVVSELQWLPDVSGIVLNAGDRGSFVTQIWQLSYPDGAAIRTTNDLLDYESPSLTNDAQTLCVVQGDYRSSIWILPQGSVARAQQITNGKDEGFIGLAWTPDGKIVYSSSVSGSPDLWLMDRDGKNQKQLTADTAFDSAPAVSPDGKFILFGTERSGIPNIWRMELDGSRPRQLTGGAENYSPSISPDGKWFAFCSWVKGPLFIMKMSTEGGEQVQLSETNGYCPAISPDGKLIAYLHVDEQTRNSQIEVMDAKGGKPVKKFEVIPTLQDRGVMRWSRNGSALEYVDRRQGASNIWSQPLSGGPPKQVTDFKSDYLSSFDWSPDGKFLAVTRYSFSSDVVLMSNAK